MDRRFIARELGFVGVCPNSMDAVSDRDFVLETLFFAAVHLTHLSRWAEDLIIYSSGAFKYVQCSDAYATGGPLGLWQVQSCRFSDLQQDLLAEEPATALSMLDQASEVPRIAAGPRG